MTTSGAAKSFTPGYNQRIPDEIMTPDSVPTRLGTLTVVDGVPTAETAALAYDNLDFLRALRCFSTSSPPPRWKRSAAATSSAVQPTVIRS